MEVRHARRGDAGAESVEYTYLLSRGCSEERHYGMESVKEQFGGNLGAIKYVTAFIIASVGLRAAEITALPSNIIQEAKAIASKVSQQLLVRFGNIMFGLLNICTSCVQNILNKLRLN